MDNKTTIRTRYQILVKRNESVDGMSKYKHRIYCGYCQLYVWNSCEKYSFSKPKKVKLWCYKIIEVNKEIRKKIT